MTHRFVGTVIVSVASLVAVAGCQCHRPHLFGDRPVAANYPPPAPVVVYPAPAAVPQPLPVAPPTPPPEVRGYVAPAPADATWRPPANGGTRTVVPEPSTAEPPREPIRLYPPETAQLLPPEAPKPAVSEQREPAPKVQEGRERPSGTGEQKATTPSLPVGIPNFAAVNDQIASGLKPLLEGLDWLKAKGYRTVLHVKQPGEDDTADRREIEKRGLNYLTIDVSPATLTLATVEQFNRIVGDTAIHPLFVYDKDGMLAGGLWYLHFRTVDKASDETARAMANRLGLKEEAVGDHKAMWLAIQRILSTKPQ